MVMALIMAMANLALAAGGKKPAASNPDNAPMRLVLVRSSERGCEPVCPEWIFARGRITASTPGEFRKIFRKIGKLPLPVVISSPGGEVNSAIAIGRMLRERKAVVIVGYNMFYGCQPDSGTCKLPPERNGRYAGSDILFPGYCYSACGLVLAGGAQRFSLPNRIGTHQMLQSGVRERVWYRETYRMVKGKKKTISRKITKRERITLKPTTKISKSTRKRLADYLAAMGVSQKYAELFEKAPPSGIYLLNGAEMAETRIVTGDMPAKSIMRKELCNGVPAPQCVRLPY